MRAISAVGVRLRHAQFRLFFSRCLGKLLDLTVPECGTKICLGFTAGKKYSVHLLMGREGGGAESKLVLHSEIWETELLVVRRRINGIFLLLFPNKKRITACNSPAVMFVSNCAPRPSNSIHILPLLLLSWRGVEGKYLQLKRE